MEVKIVFLEFVQYDFLRKGKVCCSPKFPKTTKV